ncbi:MAG TPA: tRNA (guanosine(37)-N1)-methyltransferase TrmD [Rickettsiales bacterium]|nr:tRNA (guanosine(37)-N1)-methyltransferase TrmD [Rickettsiales bacterium]
MKQNFSTIILTLFPEMFPGPLGHSLAGRALQNGLWNINPIQIRDFATDKHRTVDDTPYGGGAGMVMRPDVMDKALEHAKSQLPGALPIYFTPRGKRFDQKIAHELCQKDLILICGRFEGVDERFLQKHEPLELSIGDFILSGGEIAALTLLDACIRLLPGVMGAEDSLNEESFAVDGDFTGLLEYPHYTRPPIWEEKSVPDVLLSGNHAQIRKWRLAHSENLTKTSRPDLWALRRETPKA